MREVASVSTYSRGFNGHNWILVQVHVCEGIFNFITSLTPPQQTALRLTLL